MENMEYLMRREHDELVKRFEETNKRQDKRLELLEANVQKMGDMTNSIERLATNMESTLKELEKQGKRIETLESRDGEMWRKATGYIVTAIIGLVVGFIFSQMGIT